MIFVPIHRHSTCSRLLIHRHSCKTCVNLITGRISQNRICLTDVETWVPSSPKQPFGLVGSAMQVPTQEYPPEPLYFRSSEMLPTMDAYYIESYPFVPQQPFYPQPSYASNQNAQSSGLTDQLVYATSGRNEPLYPPRGDLLEIPGNLLPSQHLASSVQPIFEPSAVLMAQEDSITQNRSIVDHQVTANPRARFSFLASRAKVRCRYCYKLFDPKPGNLIRHADRHAGIKRYKCRNCGEAKVTKDQAVIHYITHHMGVRLGHRRKASPSERSEAMGHVDCAEPTTSMLENTWEVLSNLNAE
ncbi:hypothetical protein RSOLAG22IIIB_10701 [Rhizoctonia solani]|uniref:C2H2-type domain-containing protein n=1 Tax=Rhizoctonia solani TaxID=456999 RepID=A0A0K6G4N1_9AGAM|nr:hypothetical protein RSOLAG22IIIB_10701 [Rhizoctonia solani]